MLIYACLLFAALMLVLTKAPVAWAQQRTGRYDNHDPRAQQRELTGFGARALAAHQNTIEAFPLFAAGVLVSLIAAPGAPSRPRWRWSSCWCVWAIGAATWPISPCCDHCCGASAIWSRWR